MDLQTIIDEADLRIPNVFTAAQKIDWLNEVNSEFFDIVKIPKTWAGQGALPADVREKNIRKVLSGTEYYRSISFDTITAAMNYFTFDESSHTLTLNPPANNPILVVYDRISTTSFLASDLTKEPEAPSEYHWLYVLGLCVRIAKTLNDVMLANNYESDFKNALAVAQQNYVRAGV